MSSNNVTNNFVVDTIVNHYNPNEDSSGSEHNATEQINDESNENGNNINQQLTNTELQYGLNSEHLEHLDKKNGIKSQATNGFSKNRRHTTQNIPTLPKTNIESKKLKRFSTVSTTKNRRLNNLRKDVTRRVSMLVTGGKSDVRNLI